MCNFIRPHIVGNPLKTFAEQSCVRAECSRNFLSTHKFLLIRMTAWFSRVGLVTGDHEKTLNYTTLMKFLSKASNQSAMIIPV